MSEGLQKVAGQRLKDVIGRITSNRFSGVVTGFTVTTLVQSSSATTVMLVGFVNAGLLNLHQAIGVIMGANIGTTITGWLVALLGFKVQISAFALPAIGIGVGMTFLRGARRAQIGEVLIGFGLLFLGLSLMKSSVPGIEESQMAWVQSITESGFLSTLLFVFIGTALTVVLQSSSATMTLTLTLTASGFIPYDCAAAMVLGENLGTTATANIAAIGTSTAARRAARAHLLFNVFGVIWALAAFKWLMLPVVDALVPGDPTLAIHGDDLLMAGVVTSHLAAFHTLFNLVNTCVLLPFVNQIASIVTRLVPDESNETHHVALFISTSLVQTPELLLVQVGKEMQRMTETVRAMYSDAMQILANPRGDLGTLVEDTLAREQLIDGLEHEITAVLALTARAASSAAASRQVGTMVLNTHRLERIADHCEKLVHIAVRNHQAGDDGLGADALADVAELGELVDKSLDNLSRYLVGQSKFEQAESIERRIDAARGEMRSRYLERMHNTDMDPIPGMWLLDLLSHLEEIGDRAFGIIRRMEATREM
jgi:phosphate:Na+ symporter